MPSSRKSRDNAAEGESTPGGAEQCLDVNRSPAARLRALYEVLREAYGPQQWWPAQTRFETIVGAYLVQNTSWRGVVRSIVNLKAHGALCIEGMRDVKMEELRTLIRPSGYMVRKAAALKAFVAFLDEHHGGSLDALAAQPVESLREELLALPAIGPETADAILLYALDKPVMVVDEYLRRITLRHAVVPPQPKLKYGELQTLALSAFADDAEETRLAHFNEFHALIVEVGKNHCGPRPRCETCPLAPMLPPGINVPAG